MKIEWKEINMESRNILEPYYRYEQSKCCEISFANNYLWAPFYDMEYAIVKDMLVFITRGEKISLCIPFAKDHESAANLKEVMLELEEYFEEIEKEFHLHLVTEEKFAKLEELFPGKYEITYNRDVADYVYETEKMISLAGKKLHSKRNHINKFQELYPNHSYEALTADNMEKIRPFLEDWYQKKAETDASVWTEKTALENALSNFEALELKGGILLVDEKVVAFTIGEQLNEDTALIHFEKADTDYQGAYPMINQQFVKNAWSHLSYINREDDMGIEGLRKAKLSYQPDLMVEMYSATPKD